MNKHKVSHIGSFNLIWLLDLAYTYNPIPTIMSRTHTHKKSCIWVLGIFGNLRCSVKRNYDVWEL